MPEQLALLKGLKHAFVSNTCNHVEKDVLFVKEQRMFNRYIKERSKAFQSKLVSDHNSQL